MLLGIPGSCIDLKNRQPLKCLLVTNTLAYFSRNVKDEEKKFYKFDTRWGRLSLLEINHSFCQFFGQFLINFLVKF